MNGIYWNGEISFGHVIVVVSMFASVLGAYWAMRGRIDLITQSIVHLEKSHGSFIGEHGLRIKRLEDIAVTQTGILQNLTGRFDGWQGQERRQRPRT